MSLRAQLKGQLNMKKILILLPLLITLAACSSSDSSSGAGSIGGTRFYSLSAPLATSSSITNKLSIGIGPVEIPRLLNRPQIVSRKDNTEIIIAEKHQWGGSYKEELIKALTDNFSSLLKTERIEEYPWKSSFKPNYQVRIDIESFDGQVDKSVILNARWRLVKNNKELLVKRAVIEVPVSAAGSASSSSYGAYVKAQSQAISRLSQEIVANIQRSPK